jgi:hypothetical protein
MNGTRVIGCRGITTGVVAGALLFGLLAMAPEAEPKRIKGTNGPDKIKGTKKKDKIKAKGGNDRVKGRKGKDKLAGGGGNDTLKGGKGKDAHKGGAGNDLLNAVDRRADKSVAGGPGNNTCRIDMADLPVATGCTTLQVAGGSGDGGPGGGGPGGPGGGLTVTDGTGLSCGSSLPTCIFQLNGEGADAQVGTVTGGGGVTLAAGGAVSIESDGNWTAAGTYGCIDDGFLRVSMGSDSVDVPITCTTP